MNPKEARQKANRRAIFCLYLSLSRWRFATVQRRHMLARFSPASAIRRQTNFSRASCTLLVHLKLTFADITLLFR